MLHTVVCIFFRWMLIAINPTNYEKQFNYRMIVFNRFATNTLAPLRTH